MGTGHALCSVKGADGVTRVEPGGAGVEEGPFGKGSVATLVSRRPTSDALDCSCDRPGTCNPLPPYLKFFSRFIQEAATFFSAACPDFGLHGIYSLRD